MSCKVSICIPAYEQPDGLRRALESVRIQSWTDYEVVVCDDSSSDRVQRVAEEFASMLPIRYQRNSPSKGSPENWNECMRLATGEYIKILHHDDWFSHERSLEQLVKLLDDDPEASIGFCASYFHFAREVDPTIHRCDEAKLAALRADPRVLFCENTVGPPSSTIFRSGCGCDFDPSLIWVVDIDFYIRVMAGKAAFAYCDEPLVSVTNGQPDQVTAQCLADNALQVRENLHLYRWITKGRALNYRLFSRLSALLCWLGVRSTRDLAECGVHGPMSFGVRAALRYSLVLRAYWFVCRKLRRISSGSPAVPEEA